MTCLNKRRRSSDLSQLAAWAALMSNLDAAARRTLQAFWGAMAPKFLFSGNRCSPTK